MSPARRRKSARIGQAKTSQMVNDVGGIGHSVNQPSALLHGLVMLEKTAGGCEFEVPCALQAIGLTVTVVNPRPALDFDCVMGGLSRTNAVDAGAPTAFGRVLHRHPERVRFAKPPADVELQQLGALVLRQRQLLRMLTPGTSA